MRFHDDNQNNTQYVRIIFSMQYTFNSCSFNYKSDYSGLNGLCSTYKCWWCLLIRNWSTSFSLRTTSTCTYNTLLSLIFYFLWWKFLPSFNHAALCSCPIHCRWLMISDRHGNQQRWYITWQTGDSVSDWGRKQGSYLLKFCLWFPTKIKGRYHS